MRILTLVTGKNALPDVARLTGEIRAFNAEIDFRLRFLHVEIEDAYAAAGEHHAELSKTVDRAPINAVAPEPALEAAARLAVLLERERHDVLVVAGGGALREPGLAAARATDTKVALFGADRGGEEGALDLGEDARAAVSALTGVAREFS